VTGFIIYDIYIISGTMNALLAAHTVLAVAPWEMIQIMMPLLLLYIQILRSMRKRY